MTRNLDDGLDEAVQEDSAELVTDEDTQAPLVQRLRGAATQGPSNARSTSSPWRRAPTSFMMEKKNDDPKSAMKTGLDKVKSALTADIAAERKERKEETSDLNPSPNEWRDLKWLQQDLNRSRLQALLMMLGRRTTSSSEDGPTTSSTSAASQTSTCGWRLFGPRRNEHSIVKIRCVTYAHRRGDRSVHAGAEDAARGASRQRGAASSGSPSKDTRRTRSAVSS